MPGVPRRGGRRSFAPRLRIDAPVHVDRTLQSDSCVNPKF